MAEGQARDNTPENDPTIDMIVGPNEGVLGYINGKNKLNILYAILMCFCTLCLWICLRKKHRVGIVVTSRRVICHQRVIQLGQIKEHYQEAFYLDHLVKGFNRYYQKPHSCWDFFLCRSAAHPDNCVVLNFFRFPEMVKGQRGLKMFAPSAAQLTIAVDYPYEESLRVVNQFLAAVLAAYPNKNFIQSVADEPNYMAFIDQGQTISEECAPEERRVPIDKNLCAFSPDERLIDALPATPPMSLCKRIQLICCSITSCGIYYWCFLNRIPYKRGYVVLTDRRLTLFTMITRGKLGSVERRGLFTDAVPNEYTQEQNFWVIGGYDSGVLTTHAPLCCGPKEYIYESIVAPGGPMAFQPEPSAGNARVENFIQKMLTCHVPAILGGMPEVAAPTEMSANIRLMNGEKIVGAVEIERQLGLCVWVPRILCCCLAGPRRIGYLIATSHRLLEVSSVKLFCWGTETDTIQNYWFLTAITRTGYHRVPQRCFGCCKENIMIGIDVSPQVVPQIFHIQYSFKCDQETAAKARHFAQMLAITHLTYAEKRAAGLLHA